MAARLLVVGAGYTGRRLAEEGRERDWEVVGTSRSDETLEALEEAGVEPVRWDVLEDDPGQLAGHVGEETQIVYSIPTLYGEYETGDGDVPRHVEPVQRVLEMAETKGADRFIYLSSTSVYGDHGGAWVDEETAAEPTAPNGKMREDIERFVLDDDRSIDTNVARLVGIYGPGRTLFKYIESGRYQLVDGGEKPTNRVHVDDIVRSVLTMIDEAPSGTRLYNVSDGNPKTVAHVVEWMVDRLGIERPDQISLDEYADKRGRDAVARWKNTYRVQNQRLVDELGIRMKYPDVFAGYTALFEDRLPDD